MPAKIKRLEFEDVEGFSATSMVNEANEEFFREIGKTIVKPVIERLKQVYFKYGRKYPWNGILAVGLRVFSLARKGYDMDYYSYARSLAKNWGLPEALVREIVDAVLAEVRETRTRR